MKERALRAREVGLEYQAAITELIGVAFQENAAAYVGDSPITHVSAGDSPVLMVHGDSDGLVPFAQSERMLEACRRAGVDARLVKVENADHDFERRDVKRGISISVEEIHSMTVGFFKQWL
jgi:dipeptidyl aminopeptidase/acylaminoacyl peptidase